MDIVGIVLLLTGLSFMVIVDMLFFPVTLVEEVRKVWPMFHGSYRWVMYVFVALLFSQHAMTWRKRRAR